MATAAVRSIGHEDRVSVVDHLEELRARLIVSLAVIAVAFGFCFWQNHALLNIINAPLAHQTQKQVKAGNGPLGSTYTVQESAHTVATQLQLVVQALERPGSGASAATKAALTHVKPQLSAAIKHLSAAPQGNKPVTLGIGEPFSTTVGIAFIFAMILSLPILLYEMYAFLLPAFSPEQRRVTTPLMLAIPFLFVAGVAFGYFVVLPAATHFLLNFNASKFDVIVQASSYYPFAALILLAMGFIFQVPVAVVAAQRAELVTTKQLRKNRRIAVAVAAVIAAVLPGDVVTMILETMPIIVLYEISIHVAALLDRRDRRRARAQAAGVPSAAMATPSAPSVPGGDDAV